MIPSVSGLVYVRNLNLVITEQADVLQIYKRGIRYNAMGDDNCSFDRQYTENRVVMM